MIVYRISLIQYADDLVASGIPARWNSRDVKLIYTAGTRALACLENLVHRSAIGSNQVFRTILIEIPANIKVKTLDKKKLPSNWKDFENIPLSREIGDKWIKENKTAVLRVPSAIIPEEYNFLLNPAHKDFSRIKYLRNEPFEFDQRLQNR